MAAVASIWPDTHPPAGDYGGPLLGGWWSAPWETGPGVSTLPNPWVDGDVVADAEARVWATSQRLATAVAATVGIHDEQWWRWLLMPWLIYAGSVIEDCRVFLDRAHEQAPDSPVVRFESPEQPPPTMGVGVALLRSPALHRALVGQIAELRGMEVVPAGEADGKRIAAAAQESEWGSGRRDPQAVRLRRRLAAALLESGRSPTAVLGHSGMSGRQAIALRRRTRARILPARVAVPAAPPPDPALRARLAECVAGGDPLTRTVAGLLPMILPRSVAEGASHLADAAHSTYGRSSHLLVGNYGPDETMNAHIAACAGDGHRVDHVQHGGFYLQARTNPQERLELREGSRFLGWREVPSPHLERIRGTHMGGTDIVVVEGLNPPDPFVIRFASTPLANQAYESNQQLEHFARAAGELPLTLRRFPRAGASRPAALRALPPARGASAVEAMRSGRLVLVAYPDTPFFEAMVLGVPTIGLWNPAHWEPRPDAAPALRALTDAGIVFDSPEQAAARVREVHPRADDWWASDEVADARGLFIARFAPPGDWLAVWSAYLRAMSA